MNKNSNETLVIGLGIILLLILGCKFNGGVNTGSVPEGNSGNRAVAQKTKEKRGTVKAESKPEPEKSENLVRSTQIVDDFSEDKDAANEKYKGKIFTIRGKITNINDVFGVMALNLRDSENESGLQCYLKDNEDVEKVSVGQEVTIRGKVRGDATDVIDDVVVIETNVETDKERFLIN